MCNVFYYATNVKYYSFNRFTCRLISIQYIEWATEATQALVTILLSFASPSQYLPLPHLSAHISPTNQSHLDPIHLESATVFWSQIQVSPLPLCPLFNAWLSSPLSSLSPLHLQEIISALIKAFAVSHNPEAVTSGVLLIWKRRKNLQWNSSEGKKAEMLAKANCHKAGRRLL